MSTADSPTSDPTEGGLKPGLKSRHMTMIALGGIIGAGLFVGSGAVIGSVGPGAVVSYLRARADRHPGSEQAARSGAA
jgi:GABA permease